MGLGKKSHLRELGLVFDQLGGQLKNQLLTQIGSRMYQSAVSALQMSATE